MFKRYAIVVCFIGVNLWSSFGATFQNVSSRMKRHTPLKLIDHKDQDIPEKFDAREQWKSCKSLQTVRNHGKCNASWAVVAATVMSDRLCIGSLGEIQVELSAQHLMTCCYNCIGDMVVGTGRVQAAWWFWRVAGLPTGGDYNSNIGCSPYSKYYFEFDETKTGNAPQKCEDKCKEKYFAGDAYVIPKDKEKGIKLIQIEILKNGPVQAVLSSFYESFQGYKSGVYEGGPDDNESNETERSTGTLWVRLLGWGVEKDTPYWLGSATLGPSFGEKGFFKFKRGTNLGGIEEVFVAGTPLMPAADADHIVVVDKVLIAVVIFSGFLLQTTLNTLI